MNEIFTVMDSDTMMLEMFLSIPFLKTLNISMSTESSLLVYKCSDQIRIYIHIFYCYNVHTFTLIIFRYF